MRNHEDEIAENLPGLKTKATYSIITKTSIVRLDLIVDYYSIWIEFRK